MTAESLQTGTFWHLLRHPHFGVNCGQFGGV